MRLRRLCPRMISVAATFLASACWAGISADNVIVVVNADSVISRTIANHYVAARDIPTGNVVQLRGVPTDLKISLDDFKSKILHPLLTELDRRRLAAQARVIAYSADFPTTVDVSAHRKNITDETVKKLQSGSASITGATYFYRFILADRGEYLNFGSNMYARGRFERHFMNPFNGEQKEQFAQAETSAAEGKHAEAAGEFAKLFDAYPSMSPLAVLAAKSYAQADQREQATELLRAAIKVGWWSKEYLTSDEALRELLDDQQIAPVLPLLDSSPIAMQGPVGFAAHRAWTATGHPIRADQGGVPYLLCCALAVIRRQGSTVDQAIEVLKRAATADRSFPEADFRFAAGGDVRAKTRFPNIANALIYIQDAGYQTDVFRSNLPAKAGSVAGLMVGRATVNLKNQPWQLVPGALAETLTSYGGVFGSAGHTKITDFLHAGAAMSSGTVDEPYSLQVKFPNPMMYGYYAKGMSAIESFYLSVASPYQLLIVGDPICQPFARAPADWIEFHQDAQRPSKVELKRRRLGLDGPQTRTRSVDFYLGGRLVKQSPPSATATIDLTDKASGVVEVRAVLVGFDRTEPRLAFSEYIDVQGPLATPTARIVQDRKKDEPEILIAAQCSQADSISIAYFGETLGTISGEQGEIRINTEKLGSGPLRLLPVAKFGDKPVIGKPIIAGL